MNPTKEHQFRNKINWYVFLLSLLVVLIHSVNLAINNQTLETMILTADHTGETIPGITGITGHIEHLLSNALGQMAVPGFFLVSGYLFFRTLRGFRDIGRKWYERMGSLVVPYGAWNVLWYLVYVLSGRRSFSLEAMSEAAVSYACNPTFWYMHQLILLTLLAPILYALLRTSWIMILSLLLLTVYIYAGYQLPLVNADALIYYGVGALFACHGRTFFESGTAEIAGVSMLLLAWILQILTPVKLTHFVIHAESGIARMSLMTYLLSGGPLACGIGRLLQQLPLFVLSLSSAGAQAVVAIVRRLLLSLGLWFALPMEKLPDARPYMKNSFFLYAVHYPIARAQCYMIKYLGIPYDGWGEMIHLIAYLLTPMVVVAAAYGLKRILQRYLPLQWKILSGGR